jgi:hypothetical protein
MHVAGKMKCDITARGPAQLIGVFGNDLLLLARDDDRDALAGSLRLERALEKVIIAVCSWAMERRY